MQVLALVSSASRAFGRTGGPATDDLGFVTLAFAALALRLD